MRPRSLSSTVLLLLLLLLGVMVIAAAKPLGSVAGTLTQNDCSAAHFWQCYLVAAVAEVL